MNKYRTLGMVFLVLALVLSKVANVNDFIIGMLYGVSIGILILSLLKRNKIK
jgi:hypothetical protein